MSPARENLLVLEISPRGEWKDTLYPEQSAEFDLTLRNAGPAPANALALFGSMNTPRFVLFDTSGREIGRYSKAHRFERRGGDRVHLEPEEPELTPMAPGEESSISFNIWTYRAALPPGRYAVEAQHRANIAEPFLSSNRYSFEVVPARIGSAPLGYENADRSTSVLAWLAFARQGAPERLLVRASTGKAHSSLMQGATSHGEFPPGSLVSLAQVPHGAEESGLGWLAVVSGNRVTLIRHNLSYPYWRSEPVTLPLTEALPVPRFPDLDEQALFLATGQSAQGPALAGVLVEEEKGLVQQWSVPVSEKPSMTACVTRVKRPASLLLVTNRENGSRIARADVNSSGKLIGGERTIRESANKVLAITPAADPESGTAFFILESSATEPDRVAVLPVSTSGRVRGAELKPLPAWPKDKDGKPVQPVETQIEEAADRSIGLAFVGPDGAFYAGRLSPKPAIGKVRHEPEGPACIRPHIAALHSGATAACFTGEGRLFFPGMKSEEN